MTETRWGSGLSRALITLVLLPMAWCDSFVTGVTGLDHRWMVVW
jgi:hypothetical protein